MSSDTLTMQWRKQKEFFLVSSIRQQVTFLSGTLNHTQNILRHFVKTFENSRKIRRKRRDKKFIFVSGVGYDKKFLCKELGLFNKFELTSNITYMCEEINFQKATQEKGGKLKIIRGKMCKL